uniref:NBR1 autophagy cargo receptor a n=1 Tax=Neogobius melanostomus TaxID=47308 RepID=A0A8C6U7A0_9GOBI
CILCEMCRHSHDPSHNLIRTKTPLSIPEHGFPRRGDRTVRKAERQRLKAERRQLRAEVKEIKKKLRLEKRGLQWSGPATSGRKPGLFSTMLCTLETRGPGVPHTSLVPTMAALFLDENLPDGTRLEPGTKFIKYWKMKNSGTISWTSETKLVFMWGNLGLASEEKREVPVPLLLPGQVGVVSVAFVAPVMEGTYTSHWRLAHCGCQFGPRVWCSIVVDPGNSRSDPALQKKTLKEDFKCVKKEKEVRPKDIGPVLAMDISHDDLYFPSVDLLTAQDLLSFELLDINIVQELEKVPNNTPADLTPCISPLPHDVPTMEKATMPQTNTETKDDVEVSGVRKLFGKINGKRKAKEEEREEEISGAQFLCETIIRSLALDEPLDHRPVRRAQPSNKPQALLLEAEKDVCLDQEKDEDDTVVLNGTEDSKVSSQTSSISSCDDYIIVLPDCFDTTRPLGQSMYSSALSQPDTATPDDTTVEEAGAAEEPSVNAWPMSCPPIHSSVNQMLCASQTLDAVTLTPEVVPPPARPEPVLPRRPSTRRVDLFCLLPQNTSSATPDQHRGQGGITEGLVKGALSVAASAYKALFTGPNYDAFSTDTSMMAMLLEMGFRDHRLNQRLLRKHGYSLLHTVNELVQMAEETEV